MVITHELQANKERFVLLYLFAGHINCQNIIKSELKCMYRVNNCTRSMHRYSVLIHAFLLVSL